MVCMCVSRVGNTDFIECAWRTVFRRICLEVSRKFGVLVLSSTMGPRDSASGKQFYLLSHLAGFHLIWGQDLSLNSELTNYLDWLGSKLEDPVLGS